MLCALCIFKGLRPVPDGFGVAIRKGTYEQEVPIPVVDKRMNVRILSKTIVNKLAGKEV